MRKVNIDQAMEIIRFNARVMNTVTFIWGQFGVGKSQMMRQLASEDEDDWLCDIRAGMFEGVDFRGLPDHATHGTGKDKVQLTVWNIPSVLPVVGNPKFTGCKGIIWMFLDEANSAKADVQGILYQLAEDRQAGEHVLLPNVRIVMAGNREGIDKGVVVKQPLPLSNRINHIEVIVSTKQWIKYQRARGVLPALCYAFYEFRPALLNTYNPGDPKQVGVKTIATPRSSERAWMVYASKAKLSDIARDAIMAGWVGEGVAAEIASFAKIWDMIKNYMPEVRRDPEGCILPKQAYLDYARSQGLTDMPADAGLGLQCAVAIAISGEINLKNANHLYKFLKRLTQDFTIMAVQYALERDAELYETDMFIDYSVVYKQVFQR